MEEYLFNAAIDEGAVFIAHDGEQSAGPDLKRLCGEARKIKTHIERIAQAVPAHIVEQLAVAGALNTDILSDAETASRAAGYIAGRLDALADPLERGWSGRVLDDGGLRFVRELRGVVETHDIDGALIRSSDASQARRPSRRLAETPRPSGQVARQGPGGRSVPSPSWTPSPPWAARVFPSSVIKAWAR